jgi:hypothetical protein
MVCRLVQGVAAALSRHAADAAVARECVAALVAALPSAGSSVDTLPVTTALIATIHIHIHIPSQLHVVTGCVEALASVATSAALGGNMDVVTQAVTAVLEAMGTQGGPEAEQVAQSALQCLLCLLRGQCPITIEGIEPAVRRVQEQCRLGGDPESVSRTVSLCAELLQVLAERAAVEEAARRAAEADEEAARMAAEAAEAIRRAAEAAEAARRATEAAEAAQRAAEASRAAAMAVAVRAHSTRFLSSSC